MTQQRNRVRWIVAETPLLFPRDLGDPYQLETVQAAEDYAERVARSILKEACKVLCSTSCIHPRQTKCPANRLRGHFGLDDEA